MWAARIARSGSVNCWPSYRHCGVSRSCRCCPDCKYPGYAATGGSPDVWSALFPVGTVSAWRTIASSKLSPGFPAPRERGSLEASNTLRTQHCSHLVVLGHTGSDVKRETWARNSSRALWKFSRDFGEETRCLRTRHCGYVFYSLRVSSNDYRAGFSPKTRLCTKVNTRLKQQGLRRLLDVRKEPRLRAWGCTPHLSPLRLPPPRPTCSPTTSHAAPPPGPDGFF